MTGAKKEIIYLDYAMQAPLPPEVREAMVAAIDGAAHPLSPHGEGARAWDTLEQARSSVAKFMGATTEEVIFTSGGTEANNAAVTGLAHAYQSKGKHIIISAIEHLSIVDALGRLLQKGWEASILPVDRYGMVDPDDLKKMIRPDTVLVLLTAASDELGTIEPIVEVAEIVHEKGAILHVDAVQAAGHVPLNFHGMGLDSMSISGPPMYGPAGIGALIIRGGLRFIPLIFGGGGEEGRRGGTPNIIGAAGLGVAADLAGRRMGELEKRVVALRDRLINGVINHIPDAVLIGHPSKRLPGHVAFVIGGAEGEAVARELDAQGIRASTGSLCARWALKPSHVLSSVGIDPEHARDTLLFTLGDGNTDAQMDRLLKILPEIVSNIRNLR